MATTTGPAAATGAAPRSAGAAAGAAAKAAAYAGENSQSVNQSLTAQGEATVSDDLTAWLLHLHGGAGRLLAAVVGQASRGII